MHTYRGGSPRPQRRTRAHGNLFPAYPFDSLPLGMSAETTSHNLPRRLGRYEVVHTVATGTTSSILLGQLDEPGSPKRPVAIKIIAPSLVRKSEVDTFLGAARRIAGVRHANVVE